MPRFNPSGSARVRQVWEMRLKAGTARPVPQHSPVTHGTSHTLPAGAVKISIPKLFAEETSCSLCREQQGSGSSSARVPKLGCGHGRGDRERCTGACVKHPQNIQRVRIHVPTNGGKYSQLD